MQVDLISMKNLKFPPLCCVTSGAPGETTRKVSIPLLASIPRSYLQNTLGLSVCSTRMMNCWYNPKWVLCLAFAFLGGSGLGLSVPRTTDRCNGFLFLFLNNQFWYSILDKLAGIGFGYSSVGPLDPTKCLEQMYVHSSMFSTLKSGRPQALTHSWAFSGFLRGLGNGMKYTVSWLPSHSNNRDLGYLVSALHTPWTQCLTIAVK